VFIFSLNIGIVGVLLSNIFISLAHVTHKQRLRELGLLGLEKRRLKGICVINMPEGRNKEYRTRLFPVVSSERTRGKGHIMRCRKFHSNRRNHLFDCGGDQTLEQAVHRVCGVSILGDIENLTGHSPEQFYIASEV